MSKNTLLLKLFIVTILSIISFAVNANPIPDPNIKPEGATISQTPTTTQVTQTEPNAIIHWQQFNINSNEATTFHQPTHGVALNRINPQNGVSQIFGHLTANGTIILVNQAGIYFASGAQVNVGNLIASTANIKDQNFKAGYYIFDEPSPYPNAAIINQGDIIAREHGLVALMGTQIRNDGTIRADMGRVVLASGNKFTISLSDDGLINFAIDEPMQMGYIKNTGSIYADGGKIIITAAAAENMVDHVINMEGVLQAKSVTQHQGEIILLATNGGKVKVSGKLDVSGDNTGGTIKINAKKIRIASTAVLDASGKAGGGKILVTADTSNPKSSIKVDKGSILNASATDRGDGGSIIFWSHLMTNFGGTALAQGGKNGGNGGFIEISAIKKVRFHGNVNLTAAHGNTGLLFFDPENLIIQSTGPTTASVSGSTYTSTRDDSIVSVEDLINALANANVLIQTGTTGNQAGDITVASNITWNTVHSLTLSAFRNINVNANITNHAGATLTLNADNARRGIGTIVFNGGHVNMSGGGQVNVFYNPNPFPIPLNLNYITVSQGSIIDAKMLVTNATHGFNTLLTTVTPFETPQIEQKIKTVSAPPALKPEANITIVLNTTSAKNIPQNHAKEISKAVTCENMQNNVCGSLTFN